MPKDSEDTQNIHDDLCQKFDSITNTLQSNPDKVTYDREALLHIGEHSPILKKKTRPEELQQITGITKSLEGVRAISLDNLIEEIKKEKENSKTPKP